MEKDVAEKQFISWLTTQVSNRGLLYNANAASRYASCLRTKPLKLNITLSTEERDVYRCRTLQEFDRLHEIFRTASNFQEVDLASGNGYFSAGLSAYRKYICYLECGIEAASPATIVNSEIGPNENYCDSSEEPDVTVSDAIGVQLKQTAAEKQFASWLTTQTNSRGLLYKANVANTYAACLRTEPLKLNITLSTEDRDIYRCRSLQEFDRLYEIFRTASNFQEVALASGHRNFSAGLSAYRRYICYLECGIEAVPPATIVTSEIGPNENYCDSSEESGVQLKKTAAEKQFASWLTTQTNSRGLPYKVNVASRYAACLRTMPLKLNITLSTEDRDIYRCRTLQEFDRLHEIFRAASNFKEVDRASDGCFSAGLSAYRRYICYLECGIEAASPATMVTPEIIAPNDNCYASSEKPDATVPDAILEALRKAYSSGFRFEATSISLLASESGMQIDKELKSKLEHLMFGRRDGVFFLPDQIADKETQIDLLATTEAYLQVYGCFEVSEVFQQFEKRLSPVCIKSTEDFEDYYIWASHEKSVRCVAAPQIGNRIFRYSAGNLRASFMEVTEKILSFINDLHYGSCTEDELHKEFSAFSKNLLSKIVRFYASDKLVRVEINDTICYQSFVALGLPEDFAEILSAVIERLDEIGLAASQETLHTALSLELGVNFKSEFSLPDWDTFRRLTNAYYKGQPNREWKNNVFAEVDG